MTPSLAGSFTKARYSYDEPQEVADMAVYGQNTRRNNETQIGDLGIYTYY
jgi:hypothetical protein